MFLELFHIGKQDFFVPDSHYYHSYYFTAENIKRRKKFPNKERKMVTMLVKFSCLQYLPLSISYLVFLEALCVSHDECLLV